MVLLGYRLLLISAVARIGFHLVQLGTDLTLRKVVIMDIFAIKIQNGISFLTPIKLSFPISLHYVYDSQISSFCMGKATKNKSLEYLCEHLSCEAVSEVQNIDAGRVTAAERMTTK